MEGNRIPALIGCGMATLGGAGMGGGLIGGLGYASHGLASGIIGGTFGGAIGGLGGAYFGTRCLPRHPRRVVAVLPPIQMPITHAQPAQPPAQPRYRRV